PGADRARDAEAEEQQARGEQRRDRGLPADPAHGALGTRDRPGRDRLALLVSAEIVRQGLRRRVAGLRRLLEALQADRLEVSRQSGVQARGPDGLLADDLTFRVGR